MPRNHSFIGSRLGARRCASPLLAGMMLAAVFTSGAAAQHVLPGVGVFGEATRPNAIRLDNAGFDDDLLAVNINGYWGLLNQRVRLVAAPQHDWTDDGYDGLARATIRGKTGFLQGNGDWRFDPEFDELDRFEDGFAVFQGPAGGYGYLDKAKKIRHEPEFDAALRFKDGRAVVRVGDRLGYLDARMQLVTPLGFTAARSFHDGVAAVRLAGEGEAAGATGANKADGSGEDGEHDEKQADGDDDYRPHAGGLNVEVPAAEAAANPEYRGRWGYLDKTGRMAFVDASGAIEALGDFNDNLARFRVGDKWGYLDQQFRVAVEPIYQDARDFTNGLAAVKQDGKWGYIDRRYKTVVPFDYEEADDFDENLAMVQLKGKVGFIDRTGRIQIEPEFESAEPFRNGVARVKRDDSFAYIGVSGYVFFDPRDAREGIIDVRNKENARLRGRRNFEPYNRFFPVPRPRPTLPAPYPPEYLYDEGLDVSVDWQLGS